MYRGTAALYRRKAPMYRSIAAVCRPKAHRLYTVSNADATQHKVRVHYTLI